MKVPIGRIQITDLLVTLVPADKSVGGQRICGDQEQGHPPPFHRCQFRLQSYTVRSLLC